MDPVRNPYSPGAASPPPALVGRDEELEAFDIAVQRFGLGKPAKSLMLTGLRGVGKTVLLREFGQIAKGHGWVHQHLEATEDLKFAEAMAMLVRKALLRLSAGQRLADRGRRAFGVLKSFQVCWQLPEGVDLTVGVDPVPGHADSGALEDDLAGLFIEVGELARDRAVVRTISIGSPLASRSHSFSASASAFFMQRTNWIYGDGWAANAAASSALRSLAYPGIWAVFPSARSSRMV